MNENGNSKLINGPYVTVPFVDSECRRVGEKRALARASPEREGTKEPGQQ